ncbi:MAG: alanyl-tRNA editing protein, partial [FCB group bacterium]|nr:alanyl-tRNA editing protein [FCB group bacterium]
MTERLYYKEPGLLEFEARIVEVGNEGDRFFTVLDRSAFYPTSGGQLHDTGTL